MKDANSGAIRLSNDSGIVFRSSEDDADIRALDVDTDESINLGNNSNAGRIISRVTHEIRGGPLDMSGNTIFNVGGTTDASSGAIRLGSGSQSINARDATSGQDFGITFSENGGNPIIDIGNTGSTEVTINQKLSANGNLNLEADNDSSGAGSVNIQVGGTNVISATQSSNVEIPNGNLLFSQGNQRIGATNSLFVDIADSGSLSEQFVVRENGGLNRFRVNSGGLVEVPEGDLEVGKGSGGDVRIAGELTENASI